MRQLAYPAAIGCGFALGAGASQVSAAEWSVAPVYSVSTDYDTNRRLGLDAQGTEAAVLTADLRFKRALENTQIVVEPRYTLRRFSDSSLGNGDDRSVFASFDWLSERSKLDLTASFWDQSTLLTELLETGIVNGDSHRRLAQAGGNWTWNQTERRQLVADLSYTDVSYYGSGSVSLPGYRYPAADLGERYNFSEKGNITVSAYGSSLASDTRGNSSHEVGIRAEVVYSFSDLTRLDALLGESKRVLAGVSSHGTDASISLTRALSRGHVDLSYVRSLVPYGTGFLVERQQETAAAVWQMTPYLDSTISLTHISNNQLAVLLGVDRRSYDTAVAGLNWRVAETWAVGAQLASTRTQLPGLGSQTVSGWRTSLSLTWSPRPDTRSW